MLAHSPNIGIAMKSLILSHNQKSGGSSSRLGSLTVTAGCWVHSWTSLSGLQGDSGHKHYVFMRSGHELEAFFSAILPFCQGGKKKEICPAEKCVTSHCLDIAHKVISGCKRVWEGDLLTFSAVW